MIKVLRRPNKAQFKNLLAVVLVVFGSVNCNKEEVEPCNAHLIPGTYEGSFVVHFDKGDHDPHNDLLYQIDLEANIQRRGDVFSVEFEEQGIVEVPILYLKPDHLDGCMKFMTVMENEYYVQEPNSDCRFGVDTTGWGAGPFTNLILDLESIDRKLEARHTVSYLGKKWL